MNAGHWQVIWFTVQMALLSTLVMIPPGLALAWLLARWRARARVLLETLVTLPLVLPPVVTGLVLLKLFGRRGPVGGWLADHFGIEIVFTWRAVVMALSVMALPLFVRTVRVAIEDVSPAVEQVARTLGAGEWRVFFTITLPLARRGLIAGTMLGFARALGEFGATIMVAGSIPGQTTTLSVAIYQAVQVGDDMFAYGLAGVSALLAFCAVLASELIFARRRK